MNVFVFPGQGSQRSGMGEGLFDEIEEFKSVEPQVDEILGYSVRDLCLRDSDNLLKQTQYTQPSLYVVNALHYYKAIREGGLPDAVLGHSLGEYNALLAAGAFSFVNGLRLVKRRGELMAKAKNGGMAAVLGLDAGVVGSIISQHEWALDVANYNSSSQTVIAGPTDDLERAQPIMEKAGARLYVRLPVSAAFHSRYMAEAAPAFEAFLSLFWFERLRIPVIANATGLPYPTSTCAIRNLLVRQIVAPVQWKQSIQHAYRLGAKAFRELGPGTVLTRLIQEIQAPAAA